MKNDIDGKGLVLQALLSKPSALLSDIDGTLSPIAATPAEATVLESCRFGLNKLAAKLELVSVLSGRPVAEARRMVGLDHLTHFGNHGLERWDIVHGYRSEAEGFAPSIAEVRAELERQVKGMPGVQIEDKRIVISIHYRLASEEPSIREKLLILAESLAKGLLITEGKKVIELRPPVAVNKGTVVRNLITEYGLNGIVYIGDDLTDIDAFNALRNARHSGVHAAAVAVGGPEAKEELLALADLELDGPSDVGALLQELAWQLTETSGAG